jgi:hypothetical protein
MITVILGIGLTVILGLLKFAGVIHAGPAFIWLPLLSAIGLEVFLVITGYIADFRTLPPTDTKVP